MHYKKYFWVKIALSLFVSSTGIALLCIALFFSTMERKTNSLNLQLNEENLVVAMQNIEKMLDRVETSAVSIFFDKDVKSGILSQASGDYSITTYNQTYSNLLRVLNTTPEIGHILIYSRNGFHIATCSDSAVPFSDYDSCIQTLQKINPAFSDEQTYPQWFCMGGDETLPTGQHWLVNVRVLRDTNSLEPAAVMLVYMKEPTLARMYSFFSDDICIVDEAGTVISASDSSAVGTVLAKTGENSPSRIQVYIPSLGAYLTAVPDGSLLQEIRAVTLTAGAVLFLLCALLSFVCAVWISRGLTRPIDQLKETMEQALATGFSQKYIASSTDEIGYLGEAFNRMMDDIHRYIADIAEAEHRNQRSEIKFLQAQINPHLLYNTLDTAQYFVSLNDNRRASDILQLLSSYFKSSLWQGHTFVSLSQEIENVHCYMELQRLCRSKNIQLSLQVPEELGTLKILRITLQPVVENTYLHAFLGTLDDGTIEIAAQRRQGQDIDITVTDDGVGLDEETLRCTREAIAAPVCEGKSFGLWNLNRRLKTCYGEPYGISLDSCFGEYTRITIHIAEKEDWQDV